VDACTWMNFRLGKYYRMKILSPKNLARVGLAVAVTLNFVLKIQKQNIEMLSKQIAMCE
jgi:hypothetical protein